MQLTKPSIILVIPYFGKLPWYFNYFKHSCSFNKDVQFCIITDDWKYDKTIPQNFEIIHKTFGEMKSLIKKKLGLKAALDSNYKLCDFKPAYGLIFSEYIKGYDFWGMADMDVIMGKIRHFMTDMILKTYDIITVRHDFLVGYFTLFRNCKIANELFKESVDFKKVFQDPRYYNFDECSFAFWKMTDKIGFEGVKCEIDSMTHVVKRLHEQKAIKAYFNLHVVEGLGGKIKWDRGTLIYKNKYEIMLYHLIKFKKIYHGSGICKIPKTYRISPKRIY